MIAFHYNGIIEHMTKKRALANRFWLFTTSNPITSGLFMEKIFVVQLAHLILTMFQN